MSIKSSSKMTKRLNPVLLGLTVILLILGIVIWYVATQRNKVKLELTPEDIVQAFQDAGFEITDLTYDVYYPADYVGEQGVEFTLAADNETYSILVAVYASEEEAQYVAKGINGLNRSMNGGHASAFSYGAILVQVYPSDEAFTNKLHRILRKID